jgi:hypothetical protein
MTTFRYPLRKSKGFGTFSRAQGLSWYMVFMRKRSIAYSVMPGVE